MTQRQTGAISTYSVEKITPLTVPYVKNAIFARGTVKTVCPPAKIGALASGDGGAGSVVRAKCSFAGIDVFRVGRSLYAKNASDTVSRIQQNFFASGTNTVIFHDNGTFYMTDGSRILTVTDSLATGTANPYIPTVLKFNSATDTTGTEYEKPNALSDNVKFHYSLSEPTTIIYLPSSVKLASVVEVKYDNGSTYGGTCTLVTQAGTTTLGFSSEINGNFSVTLRLGTSTDDGVLSLSSFSAVRNALYSATHLAVLYPGFGGMKMTLMLAVGQSVCALGVKEGLYVSPDSQIVSPIGQTPSAMLNYSDGALVFTPSSVIFARASGGGSDAVIEMKTIKRDVGCDMPGSAVGFDDRIFFANTEGGIYYIDKFGLTDRDGSCRVSSLIDGELLANTRSALEGAVAIADGTSYYLSVGGVVYVWRYADGKPSSPDESEEKKLGYSFSRLTSVDAGDFIGTRGGKVYMIAKSNGYVYRFDENASPAATANVATEIETNADCLGTPHEKVMTSLVVSAELSQNATVRVYYDGVEAKSTYTLTKPSIGGVCSFIVRAERHKFRALKIRITATRPITLGGFEISFAKTGF